MENPTCLLEPLLMIKSHPMKLLAWSLFLCLGMSLQAQTSSGTIDGTVLDPSGALIAGAKVRLLGALIR